MTAPTLPIHVEVAGLAQLQGVLEALRQMDGLKVQGDPLKEMRETLAKDATAVKTGLEAIDKHFEDLRVRLAGRGGSGAGAGLTKATKEIKDAGKNLSKELGTVTEEVKKRQLELEAAVV
jgi:hypothetical protein